MKYGYIYRMTFPSGKKYVGQTTGTVENRHQAYKSGKCKSQPKLYKALKKYGYESCDVEKFKIPTSDLSLVEILIIAQEDSYKNGYNCTVGGEGVIKPADELKYGLRSSDPNYVKARYHGQSEEQKEKAKAKVLAYRKAHMERYKSNKRGHAQRDKVIYQYYGMKQTEWRALSREERSHFRDEYYTSHNMCPAELKRIIDGNTLSNY